MHRKGIFLATLCASLICTGRAAIAAPLSSSTTYACGFDSSGYTAPGTMTPVDVGGVFTMTIAGDAVTQSSATLSVDDGGDGPAVCTYPSGSGSVQNGGPNTENASISYQPGNDNSSLCPADSVSLTITPSNDGLSFIYTNADGFVGHGSCGIAGAPAPSVRTFDCKYTVKNEKGTGAGLTVLNFNPALNTKPTLGTHALLGVGTEVYPNLICPLFGPGIASFNKAKSTGNWGIGFAEPENCPMSPLSKVNFTASQTTIFITAPGLSMPTCTPGTTGAPSISVTPTSLDFGQQTVKTTSPSKTLTVQNSGSAPTEITGYLIKGDFDQTNDCGALSAGGSCTVKVTFTPQKKGAQSGNIQILTPQDKVQVSLKGSGK